MPAGAGAQGISENLGVHVRVPVDKAGRDDGALGLDHLLGGLLNLSHRGNLAATDSDIAAKAWRAGTVDHHRIANDQV
jgi:hypothetical protein